jgi:hypothetical protein
VRAREDGASRALEESLGWGSCRGVDEPHIASFGAGVMSKMTGIQRAGGPRIREVRRLRLSGTGATFPVCRDAKTPVCRDADTEVRRDTYGRCGSVQ